MSENQGLPARGADDEWVHLLDADSAALVDPAFRRTRCGEDVVEVYNDRREATCATCTESTEGSPV